MLTVWMCSGIFRPLDLRWRSAIRNLYMAKSAKSTQARIISAVNSTSRLKPDVFYRAKNLDGLKNPELRKVGIVLLEFFKTRRVRSSLKAFHAFGVSGWERWWQTELAVFLAKSDSVTDWDMEHSFEVDGRTKHARSRLAIDIGFRLKNHSKDWWHFLELSQSDSFKRCIAKMCRDMHKVTCAKQYSLHEVQRRYIVCAGIVPKIDNPHEVEKYARAQLKKLGVAFDGLFIADASEHHSLLVF
jgi:hypothetical protein